MNEDRKKRGLANGKFFTAVAICALFLGSGNVMAAQTASDDSQGVQEQMQSISVTVTVVDTKGEPIIGANVIEKGTTNGGITDLDGVSKLNVKPGAILQVSFVGYTTQEVKATSVMKVVLKDDTELLDEVVVVGYGAQKKVNLTGAVASVDVNKTIDSRPITDSLLQQIIRFFPVGCQLVCKAKQFFLHCKQIFSKTVSIHTLLNF